MRISRWAVRSTFVALASVLLLADDCLAQKPSDVLFRDDFVGKSLRPEWQVLGRDDDRSTLIDDEYLLLVTTKQGTNVMSFNGELPSDYEVLLKVAEPPKYEHQVVRLNIVQDKDNQITLAYHRGWRPYAGIPDGEKLRFWKALRGEWSSASFEAKLSSNHPLYLMIRKSGVEYSGLFSTDGNSWTEVGRHVFLKLDAKPSFETFNGPNPTITVPESGIRFDAFEIRPVRH